MEFTDPLDDILDTLGAYESTAPLVVPNAEPPKKPKWLYDFCRDIMGFSDMCPQPHYEVCNELEWAVGDCKFHGDQQRSLLVLLPRDSFKTVIGVQALAVAVLTRNPNARILITSHKQMQANQRASAVRKTFERNEAFLKKYGDDWKPEFREEQWSDGKFTIMRRTHKDLREPSVQAAAVGADVTGSHFDLILVDDIVNLENSYTRESRDKVHDYLSSLYPHLEPGGTLIVIGTRWHDDDVYGRVIAEDEKRTKRGESPIYRKLIRGCYDGLNGLFFPTRLTHNFLSDMKSKMRSARIFAANYLNQTIADEDKTFKKEYLQIKQFEFFQSGKFGGVVRTEHEQLPVNVTMRWDTAGTKHSGKSDFHGLTIVGTDSESRWWILHSQGIKGTPSEVINKVVALLLLFRPATLGIEALGSYHHWLDRLQPFLDKYRINSDVFESKTGGVPKQERIEMLEPMWTNRMLFFKAEQTSLLGQIDSFSMASLPTHDDELDSLAMHLGGTEPAGEYEYISSVNPKDPEAAKRASQRGQGNAFRNILIGRRR